MQRTLAEPLRPVAIGDDFRQSLASFHDPSFVAPLSHHVDPSTGGLVDGLAAPGRPYAHPSVADLPVPARPAAPAAPRVQRSVAWSGSADLPTVSWELPGLPADEPVQPSPRITAADQQPGRTVGCGVPSGDRSVPRRSGRSLPQPRCRCSVRWRRCRRARHRGASCRRSARRASGCGRPVDAGRLDAGDVDAGEFAADARGAERAAGWSNPRPSKPRSADLPRRSPVWVARTRFPAGPRMVRSAGVMIGPSPARRFSD